MEPCLSVLLHILPAHVQHLQTHSFLHGPPYGSMRRPPKSTVSTRTGPLLPHVLLVANMCFSPGRTACRLHLMRSFFPASNRLRLGHSKRSFHVSDVFE